jgi:DNA-binding CsgD family transcriptional regulator
MSHSKKAYLTDFSACHNFKELWESLHYQLKLFKINTIFYGIAYSKKSIEEIGLLRTVVYKTSHPKAYRELLSLALHNEMPDDVKYKILLDEDLTAKQIFLSEKPHFIWGEPNNWHEATNTEKEVDKELIDLELVTGVTISLKDEKLLAGVGLSAGILSKNTFDQIWAESSDQILKIARDFNYFVLNEHIESFIGLTEHQKEVFLKHLLVGNSKEVAEYFNCNERNISDILSTVRKKFNAVTNEQASIKANIFGILPLN